MPPARVRVVFFCGALTMHSTLKVQSFDGGQQLPPLRQGKAFRNEGKSDGSLQFRLLVQ